MQQKLYTGLDQEEMFRFRLVDSTSLVEQMRKTHHTSTTATAALGRLITMAALMSDEIKGEKETITLKIKGDGPSGPLIAEANGKGHIRGYLQNPTVDIPTRVSDHKLDVSGFVGRHGTLVIIRDFGLKEPYTGHTNLVSGEIAEDFAHYFYTSQQTPTVVSLGVLVDTDYSVKSAGGLFIQALPGVTEEAITKLEKELENFPSISSIFRNHISAEEVFQTYFSHSKIKILGEKEISYQCQCSQETVDRTLISLGEKELQDIIDKDGKCELTCQFCKKKYFYSKEELESLLNDAKKIDERN